MSTPNTPRKASSDLRLALEAIDAIGDSPSTSPRHEVTEVPRPSHYPTLDPVALHGPIGQAVASVEAFTEADPASILASLLAFAGALIGRGTSIEFSGISVVPNLFVLIIGPSNSGRKGTSLGMAKRLLGSTEALKEISGLGSGEALVAELSGDSAGSDHAVIVESEFARLLESAGRSGSTLSPLIRQLFDGDALARRTAEKEQVAAGYHAAVIGHITPDELLLRLSASDQTNGMANRFLMVASHTSQRVCFDDRGNPNHPSIKSVGSAKIATLAAAGANRGRLMLSDGAFRALSLIHRESLVASDNPLLARLMSHLLRLTLIYAVIDGSEEVEKEHVKAALAFIDYARSTTMMVFPSSSISPTAQKILAFIEAECANGIDKSSLTKKMGSHIKADERDVAIDELVRNGAVAICDRPSNGRTATVYVATAAIGTCTDLTLSAPSNKS